MERIYLDSAATTSLDKRVLKAMSPYFSDKFGNPGSIHFYGQEALKAIDKSREIILKALGEENLSDFRNVIFCSSATEANNLALRGAVKEFLNEHKNERFLPPRIIISAIEHDSIIKTAEDLQSEGAELVIIPVDKNGIIDLKKLEESLNDRTAIVSIGFLNNEIGVIEPIKRAGEIIKQFKTRDGKKKIFPLFHSDVVQSFQYFEVIPKELNLDLLTFSGHKMSGPKGVGVLYIKNGKLHPVITGGGQEFGLRAGTENVPAIVGIASAVELAVLQREKERARVNNLKKDFYQELIKIFKDALINGPETNLDASGPHILNVYFPEFLGEEMVCNLDLAGVAVSTGSACSARSIKPSHVITALGYDNDRAKRSVRFSFGKDTDSRLVREAIRRIKKLNR